MLLGDRGGCKSKRKGMTGPFAEKLWASTSVAGHQGRFQVEDEACRELLSNLKECLSSLDPGTIRHMPNCRSPTGRTPVIVAAAACNLGALEALLNVGYSTDDTQQNGLTALSFAARDGDEKIVAQLLKSGANPSIHDYFGAAPLHKAVSFGHPGVLQKMLQIKGVDVNLKTIPVRDNYPVEFQATSLHETPLHLAVSSTRAIMENPQKRYQSLDLLLATGAGTVLSLDITCKKCKYSIATDFFPCL